MNECVRCPPTLALRQLQLGLHALTVGVAGATLCTGKMTKIYA